MLNHRFETRLTGPEGVIVSDATLNRVNETFERAKLSKNPVMRHSVTGMGNELTLTSNLTGPVRRLRRDSMIATGICIGVALIIGVLAIPDAITGTLPWIPLIGVAVLLLDFLDLRKRHRRTVQKVAAEFNLIPPRGA